MLLVVFHVLHAQADTAERRPAEVNGPVAEILEHSSVAAFHGERQVDKVHQQKRQVPAKAYGALDTRRRGKDEKCGVTIA